MKLSVKSAVINCIEQHEEVYLKLIPAMGHTLIESKGNRLIVSANESHTEEIAIFQDVSECFYDSIYQQYDARALRMQESEY